MRGEKSILNKRRKRINNSKLLKLKVVNKWKNKEVNVPRKVQSDSTLSVLLKKPQRQWSAGQKLLYSHELG